MLFPILLSILFPLSDGNYATLSEDSTAIMVGEYRTAKQDTLVELSKMRVNPLEKVSDFIFSPDASRVLLTKTDADTAVSKYYLYKVESNRCDRLSDNPHQSCPVFSNDGKKLAFVRDNNVIIKRLEYNTEIAVTTDGSATTFNGVRDRNFREAFGIESTLVWSYDSNNLIFSKNNELYMYSMQYKWTKPIVMPDTDAAYITAVELTQDPEQIAVMYLNKAQNTLKLVKVNINTFVVKDVYEYKEDKFVPPFAAKFVEFLEGTNNFVVARCEDDRKQLYLYGPNGNKLKQLTNGEIGVTSAYGYDAASKRLYYQTSDGINRYVCSVSADGSKPQTITPDTVSSLARFSADYKYFECTTKTLNSPTQISVFDVKGNKVKDCKTLDDAPKYRRELRKIDNLNYYIAVPNSGSNGKYIMYVSDFEGNRDDAFEVAMCDEGYTVVVVKTRGTEGQGRNFAQGNYLNIFKAPAFDYITVANDIISRGEASEFIIVGEKLNAGVALSAILADENPFNAAVAVSPVADIRDYNPIVTQRIMKTEGATSAYIENSAVNNISKLNKKVLILHSENDTEIPLEQTKKLSRKLVDSGIQFESQIFFGKDESFTRGIANKYLINKILNFIK
ncbi:MAG: S9 family peptidase [Paludibacteraceae bacterium]|nr:S9 family peptidase [Paludibacteraceae bacterium]